MRYIVLAAVLMLVSVAARADIYTWDLYQGSVNAPPFTPPPPPSPSTLLGSVTLDPSFPSLTITGFNPLLPAGTYYENEGAAAPPLAMLTGFSFGGSEQEVVISENVELFDEPLTTGLTILTGSGGAPGLWTDFFLRQGSESGPAILASVVPTPEPAAWGLVGISLAALLAFARKRAPSSTV